MSGKDVNSVSTGHKEIKDKPLILEVGLAIFIAHLIVSILLVKLIDYDVIKINMTYVPAISCSFSIPLGILVCWTFWNRPEKFVNMESKDTGINYVIIATAVCCAFISYLTINAEIDTFFIIMLSLLGAVISNAILVTTMVLRASNK